MQQRGMSSVLLIVIIAMLAGMIYFGSALCGGHAGQYWQRRCRYSAPSGRPKLRWSGKRYRLRADANCVGPPTCWCLCHGQRTNLHHLPEPRGSSITTAARYIPMPST